MYESGNLHNGKSVSNPQFSEGWREGERRKHQRRYHHKTKERNKTIAAAQQGAITACKNKKSFQWPKKIHYHLRPCRRDWKPPCTLQSAFPSAPAPSFTTFSFSFFFFFFFFFCYFFSVSVSLWLGCRLTGKSSQHKPKTLFTKYKTTTITKCHGNTEEKEQIRATQSVSGDKESREFWTRSMNPNTPTNRSDQQQQQRKKTLRKAVEKQKAAANNHNDFF